ncbi:prepilin-type N-terminal cleavage/methylation domain-containing protein [Desulfofundulus luciae]|uniref:Prepilin-type N-terminal cleavage/methylation domain-containing protein n=1 Tax=Desulfofundulus luciae TaxID=74702 RepID=A0ABU0B1B9_9FIRM|nr:prepilin-type N-terminal cleavage/methylation domain-containing protein [Desulfofundulus luciae]MDQ0286526.1 prepilin-type N-terminal cleavage/methylation domain-containing protein [Desulfofundulus luciae]
MVNRASACRRQAIVAFRAGVAERSRHGKAGTEGKPVTGWRAWLPGLALGCRGLTLIEVLVTAVLLSLILGAAYFVVDSTMLNWKKGDEQVDVQQNLRLAMDRLTRELRVSAGVDEINPQSYIIFKSPDNAKYIKYYLYGGEIKRATSSNKIIWEGDNPVAGRVQAVSFQGVTGLPATVEIKLTGTNGFVLTSRVTVRMIREQN